MDIIARTITQSSRCTRAPIISLVRFQGCLLHSFLTINSLTTRLVYNPTNPYHQPRGFVVDWIVVDWLSPLSAAAWLLSQSTTAGCEPVANKPPCCRLDHLIAGSNPSPLARSANPPRVLAIGSRVGDWCVVDWDRQVSARRPEAGKHP